MGIPNPPIGIRRRSLHLDDRPVPKSATSKASRAKASADHAFDASGEGTGYSHSPTMTAVNAPVPQTSFPSLGIKGETVRPKDTSTPPRMKGMAKKLTKRWFSDAAAAITHLATSPTMWHLAAPAYLDLVMKAGAKYKAKYTQCFCPPGYEHPDHVTK